MAATRKKTEQETTEAEAPKKRTRAKKTTEAAESTAKKTASKSSADKADDIDKATEDAPKKTTRRKKTATAAEKAPEASAEPDSEKSEEAAKEAPKRKTTRTRKKTSEEVPAETEKPAEKEAAEEPQDAKEAEVVADKGGKKAEDVSSDEESKDSKSSAKQNGSQGAGQNGQNSQNNQNNHNNRNGRNRNRRNRDNRQREYTPSVSREDLETLRLPELREKAAEIGIDASGMKKAEMVEAIYKTLAIAEGFLEVGGILDILQDGYGFLRTDGYLPGEHDVYVGLSTIRRNGLRKGDYVTGQTRPAREGEKFAAIQKVLTINGIPVDECDHRPKFSDLTPIFPDERLLMEHGKNTITARVIDLAAPIGKGQRGLIVSPPKAGKTTILKDIAAAITANNPEVHLMYLGIDERPEEATDMERSIKGEVVSSTFDMPSENHIQVAELVIERAKRLVEQGKDVVILLDSITRLARAYNLAQPASGRVLSGGVDSTALYPPKRFLGAARNIENGGSLTILASALVDTGSKMDEVIFEEFKGTGNMELKLDRSLADRRIFPAIDPVTSGTRKEELLLDPQEAPLIWAVRRLLANMNNTERAMDMLIKSLKQTNTNTEFLLRTAKKAQTHTGHTDENFEF